MENDKNLQKLYQQINDLRIDQPYLETRVLAHLREQDRVQRQVRIWQILFGSTFAFSLFLVFWNVKLTTNTSPQAFTDQAYVIHLNFDEQDKLNISQAEIELPSDVYFVAQNKERIPERKLKLPLAIKEIGRSKLPFVLSSERIGTKHIIVNLLDENNNLIKKQTLKLKFASNERNLNTRKE